MKYDKSNQMFGKNFSSPNSNDLKFLPFFSKSNEQYGLHFLSKCNDRPLLYNKKKLAHYETPHVFFFFLGLLSPFLIFVETSEGKI